MEELFEILKEFDIDNIGVLIVVCIILISIATGYIQLYHASRIEIVLMSKNEQLKRFSFLYFILFFVFVAVNYILVIDPFILIVNIVVLMLMLLLYWWFKERKDLIFIFLSTAIVTFAISTLFEFNLIGCAILGALVEVDK